MLSDIKSILVYSAMAAFMFLFSFLCTCNGLFLLNDFIGVRKQDCASFGSQNINHLIKQDIYFGSFLEDTQSVFS